MPRLAFIGTPPKKPASKTKGKKSLQTTLQSTFPFSVRTAVVAAAVSVEAVVSGKPQRQGEKGLVRERNAKRSSISSFFGGKENLPEPSLQDHGAASTKTRNNESSEAGFFQSSEAAGIIQPAELGKRKHDPIAAAEPTSKRKLADNDPVMEGSATSLVVLAEHATTGASVCFPFYV